MDVDGRLVDLGSRRRNGRALRDDQAEPLEGEQHAQRRDERADAQERHERAVDDADDHADQKRQDHRRHQPQAGFVELVEDDRREQVHRPDGEVDLPEDHHEDLARAQDRQGREVRQQGLEVFAREERAGVRGEVDRRDQRDDDDAALAQRQGAVQDAPSAREVMPAGLLARRRRGGTALGRVPSTRHDPSSRPLPVFLGVDDRRGARRSLEARLRGDVGLDRFFVQELQARVDFRRARQRARRPCRGRAPGSAGSPEGRAAGRS